MIEIKATTRRTFLFPAPASLALQFYSDFRRITQDLPHISLVEQYGDSRFRLLYSTTEMAAYQVHIFADVETEIDETNHIFHVRPAAGIPPAKSKATLHSIIAPGRYYSRSTFRPVGDQSEVEYYLELGGHLPRPLGLNLIPGSVLNSIADNITNRRMNEIIDGFIALSIADFPRWQAEQSES
jgi:hypothetical protein